MFGAIDAGLLMKLAKEKEEKEKELAKTPEGRAKLAHKKAIEDSFDNVPEGAQCYFLKKLQRKLDPENLNPPMVMDGTGGSGFVRVFTDEAIKHHLKDDDTEFEGIPWECQKNALPKIDSVFCVSGHGRWLRTSLVKGFYIYDEKLIAETGKDKLVLPANFPVEANQHIPKLEDQDILIVTMNSLYLCRKMDGVLYKKEEDEQL